MTSWKFFDFNGVNVAKHWHVAGEVFAISDCLVLLCYIDVIFVTSRDTYWIIGGLLAVDMTQTVRGILQNFLHIVDM